MEMVTVYWLRRVKGNDYEAVHSMGISKPLMGQQWDS